MGYQAEVPTVLSSKTTVDTAELEVLQRGAAVSAQLCT